MSRLNGKVALVTGAARGIGEAIARAFAANGALVYVSDIDDARGREVAASLGDAGRYLRLDVREEADWQRVTAQILAERGALDVVVNNAGITGFESGAVAHDPENATLESWHSVHRTNLDGVFLGCKHAIRAMRRAGKGSIVNISSRSGLVGYARMEHDAHWLSDVTASAFIGIGVARHVTKANAERRQHRLAIVPFDEQGVIGVRIATAF